jgi:hypothetical protein
LAGVLPSAWRSRAAAATPRSHGLACRARATYGVATSAGSVVSTSIKLVPIQIASDNETSRPLFQSIYNGRYLHYLVSAQFYLR